MDRNRGKSGIYKDLSYIMAIWISFLLLVVLTSVAEGANWLPQIGSAMRHVVATVATVAVCSLACSLVWLVHTLIEIRDNLRQLTEESTSNILPFRTPAQK